ncbi:MAG: endonuclease/exonuclease/phosphatase family protein [Prolixibacteraceae bacterium]|jgi:predicted extracellular nuclease|nr:endonuclease/exonuclease/phosphatase family protein [Prolixibacteraceae bacterium]
MKRFALIFAILFVALSACKHAGTGLTVAFYNTENLFDTEDDPHKNDNEFLPGSEKKWTAERYQKKLNDIARVIYGIDSLKLPVFVGLCEIENRKVLEDLVATSRLAPGKYAIAHQESPDLRGIDVALLYRPGYFRLEKIEAIPVIFENEPRHKTRDILHVSGKIGKETVHLFVNHWPSRIGGTDESEPNRVVAASVLKKKTDEALAENPSAHIIIMGDMNDEPLNKSLSETLGGKAPESSSRLINLMLPLDEQGLGTYNYRNEWNMLDNLVVSHSLLDGKRLDVEDGQGFIFRKEWMEFKNNRGAVSPNRTYGGSNYYGGVSDHFPVYFVLIKK